MPRVSVVKTHTDRSAIEVWLAARAPLEAIAAKFDVSRHAAGRHRAWMRAHDRAAWRALRRVVRERGICKRTFAHQETH